MVTVKRLKANFLSVSTSSEQSETDVLDTLNILRNIYTWLTQQNCKTILVFSQKINLSRNSIRSMKGLQNHNLLQEIDLEENQVGRNIS